jgi:hypothetical protein
MLAPTWRGRGSKFFPPNSMAEAHWSSGGPRLAKSLTKAASGASPSPVLTANSDFKIKDFPRHSEGRSTATSEFGSHSAVPQMLPRTDIASVSSPISNDVRRRAVQLPAQLEDFDVALDEFDRIFRRIPPPAWAHHEWAAVQSSEARASNQFAPRPPSPTANRL